MDQYSIVGGGIAPSPTAGAPIAGNFAALAATHPLPPLLDDHRKSLSGLAERDMRAALQLLAERAHFVTGASGVMIALIENGKVICRASVGEALRVGTALHIDEGLTGQSLRLKELLRCDNAEQDPRVNRDGCSALGIRSVMVAPLLRDDIALGIFELLSERPYAFEERDASSLEWLSQCVVIALDQASAARLVLDRGLIAVQPVSVSNQKEESQPSMIEKTSAGEAPELAEVPSTTPSTEAPAKTSFTKQCSACGFPVSPGRTLCVECEAARLSEEPPPNSFFAPSFLTAAPPREHSWFERNMYTIGTIAVAALTGLALYLKFH
ncbi:MAG TPA: GAF domain-containing protein [Terriglobales bacterium]